MANELDHVYFKNHIHRVLRPSDDALGEASAHGLSLASNVQIGTTGAALKIFKLDSTGNLTTSNDFVLKGTSGENSNKVTVEGTFITTKNVGIGTSSPVARVHIQAGTTPSNLLYGGDHLVITNNTSNSIRLVTSSNDAANFYSSLTLVSSRGTNDAPAASQNGDRIGRILAQGMATGVTRQEAAQILFSVDGAPTGTSVPGAIRFFTSAPTGTNLERMRITASGNLLIGQTATLITNSTSTYPSVEPRVEVLTGVESGAYDDALVLRHSSNDGSAVSRRIFLLFKHSSEDDSNASNKMTGLVSRSTSSWANSPELGFISGGNERMTLSNAGSLSVSGGIVASGGITTSGSLNVSGVSTLRGNTDILGNLTLTGTFSTPSYTINNGSGGGNTWASFSKRIFSNALAVSSDPFDQTNGAPWYGVGLSTGSFPNTANAYVQLAGFFGVLIKAGGGSSIALQSDGKVGINNTAPASGLDVASDTVFRSGVTVSGILNFNEYTNFVPTKNVHIGYWSNTAAGTVGTWYKIASFSGAAVAYSASSFMGSVLLANTNWGDSTPTEHFFAGNIVYYNGAGVLTDTASLKTSANFPSGLLQLVRTGTAGWELQLGLYSQNKIISWKIEPIAGYSPTYFDRAAAGTALATGTVTDSFDSRLGTMFGRSLDLTSTLQVDGRTDINNQLFVSGTSDQILGLTRGGAVSTGGLSIYHYLKDDANAYIQDTTMLYAGGGLTGGLIYSAANASAKHRWHVGGFNGTSSEKMQLNTNGLRLGFTSDQSTNGAATTDELQIGGSTFFSGLTTIFKDGEVTKLVGTTSSYIGFYPTGASAGSTTGRDGYIGFFASNNKDLYLNNSVSTGSIRLMTNSLDRVFIKSDGNVGINTSSPASGLDVNDNAVFRSGVTVSGTLGVSGLTSLNTLTTTGVVNANSLNVSGNTSITGTLNVSGTTNLDDVLATGAVTFRSGLTVSGSTLLNTLTVSGNTTLTGTLVVSGLTSLNTLTTTGVVNANSLNVSGNTSITGTLGVTGLTSLNTLTTTGVVNANSLNVSGNTSITGTLNVSGISTSSTPHTIRGTNNQGGGSYTLLTAVAQAGSQYLASGTVLSVQANLNTGNTTQQNSIGIASQGIISTNANTRFNTVNAFSGISFLAKSPNISAFSGADATGPRTSYGLYIETQKATNVTTGVGVYQADVNDINYFAGDTTFGSDVVVSGTLGVTGLTSLNTLTTTGVVNANSLNVSGNTFITGTLNVSGTSNLDDVLATGAVTFRSGLTVSGSTLLNTLTISGNTVASGTLGVTGTTTLAGSAYLATVGTTVSVGIGTTTPAASALVCLDVARGAIFRAGVTISGNLQVTGTSTLRGAVDTLSTLQVASDTTVTGNLSVTGTSTLRGAANTLSTLQVASDTTVTGNLSVTGTSTLRGSVNLIGSVIGTSISSTSVNIKNAAGTVLTSLNLSVSRFGKFYFLNVPNLLSIPVGATNFIWFDMDGLFFDNFPQAQTHIIWVFISGITNETAAYFDSSSSRLYLYRGIGKVPFQAGDSIAWDGFNLIVKIP